MDTRECLGSHRVSKESYARPEGVLNVCCTVRTSVREIVWTRGVSRVCFRVVRKSYAVYLHAPWRVDQSERPQTWLAACELLCEFDWAIANIRLRPRVVGEARKFVENRVLYVWSCTCRSP